MPLDPYIAAKARQIAGLTFADLEDPANMELFHAYFTDEDVWTVPTGLVIHDDTVDSANGAIPVRVYTPPVEEAAPLVWLHGGGFSYGHLDMAEAHIVSAELASRAQCAVISVDYRLATTEVRFPAPVDDLMAVWQRFSASSALGAPAIGGASAGAAIAVSTALRARDEGLVIPRALLLAYPFLHFPNPALAYDLAIEMSTLPPLLRISADSVADMVKNYVGRVTNLPRAAMPGAADLAGLPETSISVAEYDDLRPSAELFALQLAEVGTSVRTELAEGMPHGHLNRVPTLPVVNRSLDFFAAALAG